MLNYLKTGAYSDNERGMAFGMRIAAIPDGREKMID
jgi:hypothetical protein